MRQVQGADRRLPDIGVDMAGQAAHPRLDRVDALGDAGEVPALNDLLDQPELLGGDAGIGIPHRHGGGDIGLADRSEEHTSELQSLMRISYAVFCLKKKKSYKY